MIHSMKLYASPFDKISSSKKTVELRLYDVKRRKINVGDRIVFSNIDEEDKKIAVTVKALYRYASFKELFEEIPIEKCGNSSDMTIDEVVEGLRTYYSEEEEKQYGVLGIKIELADLQQVMKEMEELAMAEYEHYFPDGMK